MQKMDEIGGEEGPRGSLKELHHHDFIVVKRSIRMPNNTGIEGRSNSRKAKSQNREGA